MYKKKIKRKNHEEVTAMIGSGENSCFVRKSISPEVARQELNNKIDDALYSKLIAFVKKFQRRISNK